MKQLSISIITPSLNSAQYIETAIQSVLNQNYQNFEHLVIDGGSTDGTIEILKKYAHLKWITEKDKGQSDAMNKGIRMAKGEIIGILNVDDYYENNVFFKVAELFSGLNRPAFITGNCKVWNARNELEFNNQPSNCTFFNFYKQYKLWGFHKHLFPLNPSAYFYSKSIHDDIGYYDTNEHYTLDVDFILRVLKKYRIKYYNYDWGNFRMVEGSKSLSRMKIGDSKEIFQNVMDKHYNNFSFFGKIALNTAVKFKKLKTRIHSLITR